SCLSSLPFLLYFRVPVPRASIPDPHPSPRNGKHTAKPATHPPPCNPSIPKGIYPQACECLISACIHNPCIAKWIEQSPCGKRRAIDRVRAPPQVSRFERLTGDLRQAAQSEVRYRGGRRPGPARWPTLLTARQGVEQWPQPTSPWTPISPMVTTGSRWFAIKATGSLPRETAER